MTVGDLKKHMADGEYPDAIHVCVTTLKGIRGRREILDLWVDRYGVLNLITGPDCGEIDPDLERETGLA